MRQCRSSIGSRGALRARKAAITRLRVPSTGPEPVSPYQDLLGNAGIGVMDGFDGAAIARVRAMRGQREAEVAWPPDDQAQELEEPLPRVRVRFLA